MIIQFTPDDFREKKPCHLLDSVNYCIDLAGAMTLFFEQHDELDHFDHIFHFLPCTTTRNDSDLALVVKDSKWQFCYN